MNIYRINNPFLVYGYAGPDYFCDREGETERLISALRNRRNITLMSPRRMGKTGLIQNAFYKIRRDYPEVVCFYMDIEIFDYLEHSGKECYIAIDEFQQIAEYPEGGVEGLLRSHIQFSPHVHFIFSGSKQHIMAEMFGSAKRPFYRSTEKMSLAPISLENYYLFAESLMREGGKKLEESLFQTIYQRFKGHTWYMQFLLNQSVYFVTGCR